MSNNIKTTVTADQLGIPATPALPPASPAKLAREAAQLDALAAQFNRDAGVTPPKISYPESPLVVLAGGPVEQIPHTFAELYALSEKIKRELIVSPEKIKRVEPEALKVATSKPEPVTHHRSPFNPRLLFYTGRLKAGKDFVAEATGATVFGFADPLYAIRKFFFSEVDKDKHGAREFLQFVGQWGRGTVSAQYPISPARATFSQMIRDMGDAGEFGDWAVDWSSFGHNENLWLDGMLRRVDKYREELERGNDDRRIACVNVRFKNEVDALTKAGWCHFHVLTSQQTWEERIRAAGLDPKSPAMTDTSEHVAISLDRQAQQASQRNPNAMLRCIWNDDKQASPAPKAFHTIDSFLKDLELFS